MTASGYWAVVPAAGSGSRFADDQPKQFYSLGGQPVAQHTLARLLQLLQLQSILVPCDPQADGWRQVAAASDSRVRLVSGGATRAQSVINGLRALAGQAGDEDWVLVHDMARPCVTASDIRKLMRSVEGDDKAVGALLVSPVNETLKRVARGEVEETVDRDHFRAAQTPQMFRYGLLLQALETMFAAGQQPTDESSAMEFAGHKVKIVGGRQENIKIPRREDLSIAAAIMQYQEQAVCE